jgi:predicted homoserine dehydrogenase-like protein
LAIYFNLTTGAENLRGQKLRMGVIGLGKMGILHASILNVSPEVEIVAFCEKML